MKYDRQEEFNHAQDIERARRFGKIEEALELEFASFHDVKLSVNGKTFDLDLTMVLDMVGAEEEKENEARLFKYAEEHFEPGFVARSKFLDEHDQFIVKNHFYPDDDE